MAKAHPVFGAFWHDPDVRMMKPEEKLIFLFLMTWHPQGAGTSGIFQLIVPGDVAFFTGLSEEICADAILKKKLKNILFHRETSTVFVKNRLRYRFSGAKFLACKGIVGDFKLTSHAAPLWMLWKEIYKDYVAISEELGSLLLDLGLRDAQEHTTILLKPQDLPADAQAKRDLTIENEIEQMMSRYKRELDNEDYTYVVTVVDFLSHARRTGALIAPFRRLKMLERMGKEPTMKVARACYQFIEAGGCDDGSTKGFPYLRGIVNGSATTWYSEFMAEQDKHGLKLKGGK